VNREHLEILKLQFEDFLFGRAYADHMDFFSPDILDSGPFLSLRVLSLSHISFEDALEEYWSFFGGLTHLRSLRLHQCHFVLHFLDALVDLSEIPRLNSFEITFDEPYQRIFRTGEHPLKRFLQAFEGLEELYVAIGNTTCGPKSFMNSILHHRSTLRRWVHHHTAYDDRDEFLTFILDADPGWTNYVGGIFGEVRLECVGLCLSPSILVCMLSAPLPNFRP
jgi:hypothetical protein